MALTVLYALGHLKYLIFCRQYVLGTAIEQTHNYFTTFNGIGRYRLYQTSPPQTPAFPTHMPSRSISPCFLSIAEPPLRVIDTLISMGVW